MWATEHESERVSPLLAGTRALRPLPRVTAFLNVRFCFTAFHFGEIRTAACCTWRLFLTGDTAAIVPFITHSSYKHDKPTMTCPTQQGPPSVIAWLPGAAVVPPGQICFAFTHSGHKQNGTNGLRGCILATGRL